MVMPSEECSWKGNDFVKATNTLEVYAKRNTVAVAQPEPHVQVRDKPQHTKQYDTIQNCPTPQGHIQHQHHMVAGAKVEVRAGSAWNSEMKKYKHSVALWSPPNYVSAVVQESVEAEMRYPEILMAPWHRGSSSTINK